MTDSIRRTVTKSSSLDNAPLKVLRCFSDGNWEKSSRKGRKVEFETDFSERVPFRLFAGKWSALMKREPFYLTKWGEAEGKGSALIFSLRSSRKGQKFRSARLIFRIIFGTEFFFVGLGLRDKYSERDSSLAFFFISQTCKYYYDEYLWLNVYICETIFISMNTWCLEYGIMEIWSQSIL